MAGSYNMHANGRAGATPSRRPPSIPLCAVVGLALLLSSMWTARADASGVATPVIYATRFVSFATYMVMAWSFRNSLPRTDLVLGIALAFMGIHLVGAVAVPLLPVGDDIALILDYLSGLFEGVANALATLLFAQAFASYAPNRSALAIGVSYLLVDVGILFLDTLTMDVLHYMRPAFTLASMVLLLFCARRLSGHPLESAMSGTVPGSASLASPAKEHPLAFFSTHTDWLLLLIVAFLFPSLFGVIAQVSSETGGDFALYDISTEIVMVALQAFFLLFMAFFGTRYGFAAILAFVVPLYATGFALFPSNWSSDNPFAGCLIRAGYVILTVLLWGLMARKSHDDPQHTYLYFGIYCGISNAQAGRLVGSFLMRDTGPNLALCQGISLAALWAICIFGLVMFFLIQRGSRPVAQLGAFPTLGSEQPAPDRSDDSVAPEDLRPPTESDTFVAQFEAFAARVHLTQREREVVVEALHGYSRPNIGAKLGLSPETVKTYLNRAYAKAGITSKQELVAAIEREPLS